MIIIIIVNILFNIININGIDVQQHLKGRTKRSNMPIKTNNEYEPAWYTKDLPKANEEYMNDALNAVGFNNNNIKHDIKKKQPTSSFSSPFPRFSKLKSRGKDTALGLKGAGDCFGLVNADCVPCPAPEENHAGHAGKCDLMKSQCDNLFCDPLCLRTLPECSVDEPPPPFQEAGSKPTGDALCAVLRAHTCVTGGCCKKDDMLQDWTEQYTYGAAYPESPMMIQACRHNSEDAIASAKLCGECKAAMAGKIKVSIIDKNTICRQLESFVAEFGKDPDAKSGLQWTPYNADFGYPGTHKHKPFKERCEHLHDALLGKFPGDAAAFAASNACHCMGCCDPIEACHFPIGKTI